MGPSTEAPRQRCVCPSFGSHPERRSKTRLLSTLSVCKVRLPGLVVPTPYLERHSVTVRIATTCCDKPASNMYVQVNNRRAGATDSGGVLELALPIGRHSLTAPRRGLHALGALLGHRAAPPPFHRCGKPQSPSPPLPPCRNNFALCNHVCMRSCRSMCCRAYMHACASVAIFDQAF